MYKIPYSQKELYCSNEQKWYNGSATESAFLVGGIGTGSFSIGARGNYHDWEIFNRPAKGNSYPETFFYIWTRQEGQKPETRILESRINPPYNGVKGFLAREKAGMPHMESSRIKGATPFVQVDFYDKDLPVDINLEAFSPFIPLNADDSGIPAAVIRYKVKNTSTKKTDTTIAGTMANIIGTRLRDLLGCDEWAGRPKNEYRDDEVIRGLYYTCPELDQESIDYGNMSITTTAENITVNTDIDRWFWDCFADEGKLDIDPPYVPEYYRSKKKKDFVGGLGIKDTLMPGEEAVFEFYISWYFPNRMASWYTDCKNCGTVKNYYTTLFNDSWDAGKYLVSNLDYLEGFSRKFKDALYKTSIPGYVLEAVSNNITVIRSNTCFRLEDGSFYGYEGCNRNSGSCVGNCTHVWNYAQTMAFLFPELEQSMRRTEFCVETDCEGRMPFRGMKVFGEKDKNKKPPAADGQMGAIIRVYREWKISGNDIFLREMWDSASKALDFAFHFWDKDGDYIFDAPQWTTYDINLYGITSFTCSMFYAALKAGVEIARYLGDENHEKKYSNALSKGVPVMDEMLWNGEYYIQKIDNIENHWFQYGEGCLSDQVFGQMLAHLNGLGYILPKEHVRTALKSIFRYNFRMDYYKHKNYYKTFALNDEKGLLNCSWPYGRKPRVHLKYGDGTWTGIEYQTAAHMIYEGLIDEGLSIVKAVRERYDGYKRNPWSEVECGCHYVRSMASWALLTALSGYECDMVNNTISFNPVINKDDFTTFWSTGKAWGTYTQKKNPENGEIEWDVKVLYGKLDNVKINGN